MDKDEAKRAANLYLFHDYKTIEDVITEHHQYLIKKSLEMQSIGFNNGLLGGLNNVANSRLITKKSDGFCSKLFKCISSFFATHR